MTLEDDETLIRNQMDAYLSAYAETDAEGCAAIYASEALVITPWGPPTKGRDAIIDAHLDWFTENETNKTLTIADLRLEGNLATCLMAFSADVPTEKGGSEPSHGASLSILVRNHAGAWQIVRQMLLGLDAPLTENLS